MVAQERSEWMQRKCSKAFREVKISDRDDNSQLVPSNDKKRSLDSEGDDVPESRRVKAVT